MKIKSHQLRSNGYPKYNAQPQPCLVMVHINHWANKTCELPYANQTTHSFPLRSQTARITLPLYFYPMNIYYGLYFVNNHVSDFIATAYQANITLYLATKLEIDWYARNMSGLQSPNRTKGFTGPTYRIITHQVTS